MKKTLRVKTILKRKRRHGFRRRMSGACGRAVLARRRRKGKKILTP